MDQIKIGNYIAENRRKRDLTQKALAEKLLVSDKAVSKWERGICLPNIELLSPLSEILGVSVKALLSGEDEPEAEGSAADHIFVNAVKIYTKENQKKEKKKTLLISMNLLILVFALIVLPLYSKYHISRYDAAAQNAWSQAGTSVTELLDTASEIRDEDYRIELETYYHLKYTVSESMDHIASFLTETKDGEKVNTLAGEMDRCVNNTIKQIEIKASIYFDNGGTCYQCSEKEVKLINRFLSSLPQLYDEINEEMGIVSPGISHLYQTQIE